jgi:hypothetical protein
MKKDTNNLHKKAEKLFNKGKYDDIINLLTNKVLETHKDAGLYIRRGFSWYCKKEYDKTIADNKKALEINPSYDLAFSNSGAAWVAKKDYDKAIDDYNKAINLESDYKDIYLVTRGNVWKANKKYGKAIEDYTKAIEIKPDLANAYYSRGLVKKEENIDLKGSKQDFEEYLQLATDKNDIWAKYAKYYIEKIDELSDKKLTDIAEIVSKIKVILHIEDDFITHYTSLSVLKSLILDSTKFRISEGSFMNDPSEGIVFFEFLEHKLLNSCKDEHKLKKFSQKPFIGSFVKGDMYNDLNMWRFYGKEKGEEAKGCAITLRRQEFIDDINLSLSDEVKEARIDNETDIKFYHVAYLKDGESNFYIPSSEEKSCELTKLMEELKQFVFDYKGIYKTSLEEYLNSIAFLFKSDSYKNENEVRLVVRGIEFKKEYNIDVIPPRVFIELESIKKRVEQITLGPKVDNANEWASAFYYRYEDDAPEIMISLLPYK